MEHFAKPDRNQADSDELTHLTEDNWRKELFSATKPVMVLTISKDCSSCEDWLKVWQDEAKQHPEFKFALSDAKQFHLPESKTPIMSTIVPGIGTAYLQQLQPMAAPEFKEFWDNRSRITIQEQHHAKQVDEMQASARALLSATVKYENEKAPHSPAEVHNFAEQQKQLGAIAEALVNLKLELIDNLKRDIDPSIVS